MDRRILFIVTNHADLGSAKAGVTGWYLPELCHPFDVFEKAGFKISFTSPCGGAAPVDKSSLTDFAKDAICSRIYGRDDVKAALQSTLKIADTDFNAFEAVFVVGGHGPMWDLPNCKGLADKLAHFYHHNGLIGAVCHGPCALVNVYVDGRPLVAGKPVTCFTNAEEEEKKLSAVVPFLLEDRIKARGALFTCADKWAPCVQGDDSTRLFTGQNPASATPLAERIVQYLNAHPRAVTASPAMTATSKAASAAAVGGSGAEERRPPHAHVPGSA